ncbi:MAG TPA: AsmA family protein [Candidatus Binatia bacterium]
MKRALFIAAGVAALLALAIVLAPPLIDLGAYKARYLLLAEQALGRKVDVGEIRLQIVPAPAIRLSALQVADNPAFSDAPFFTAERMSLKLKLGPLLRGRLVVEEFVLEKPAFHLIKRADGAFNFADIAKKKADGAKKEQKSPAARPRDAARLGHLAPAVLRIEGGAVTLQTPGQKPLEIHGIDLSVLDFSTDRPFPYRMSLKAPGLKPVALEGRMRYRAAQASLTLQDSRLKAEDVEFTLGGALAGLTGAPTVDLSLVNDGFEIRPIARLLASAGYLPQGLEASGPAGLRLTLAGPSNNLVAGIHADLQGLQVSDSRAFKGTVAGPIDLAAPLGGGAPLLRKLRGDGRLRAKDGALTSVDLVKKIEQATGLIGMGKEERAGATTFRLLEGDFTLADGIADFKRIYLKSPVMEARGGGKMYLERQTADLGMEAALSPAVSVRLARGGASNYFKNADGRLVVPLRITGSFQAPAVSLDDARLAQKDPGRPAEKAKSASFFERLFSRK